MCDEVCARGSRHTEECGLLARAGVREDIRSEVASPAYAPVTILRLLLLMDKDCDGWFRTNQLMDHLEDTGPCPEEWTWYNDKILSSCSH